MENTSQSECKVETTQRAGLLVLRNLITTSRRIKADSYHSLVINVNSKWVKYNHIRPKTKKMGNVAEHWNGWRVSWLRLQKHRKPRQKWKMGAGKVKFCTFSGCDHWYEQTSWEVRKMSGMLHPTVEIWCKKELELSSKTTPPTLLKIRHLEEEKCLNMANANNPRENIDGNVYRCPSTAGRRAFMKGCSQLRSTWRKAAHLLGCW